MWPYSDPASWGVISRNPFKLCCPNEEIRSFVQRLFIFTICSNSNVPRDNEDLLDYQRQCIENLLSLATNELKNNPQYVEQYFGTFEILLKLPSPHPLAKLLIDLGALHTLLDLALESGRLFRHIRPKNLSKLFKVVATLIRHCDLPQELAPGWVLPFAKKFTWHDKILDCL